MKDIVSLLLTTTCLAITGIGIYFFSSNSHENTFVNTQKAGKKQNDIEIKSDANDEYDNNIVENPSIHHYDKTANTNYKNKSKTKTKKHSNKFSSSKKKYYY